MIHTRLEVQCDFPGGRFGKCPAMVWVYGRRESEARAEAARRGWLRVHDHDFCAADPQGAPGHASVLAGHPFAPQSRRDPDAGRRFRPACGCGWVCPDNAVHLWIDAEHGAEVGQRSLAATLWLQIHVRENIAAMPPLWTRADLQEAADRHAARLRAAGL